MLTLRVATDADWAVAAQLKQKRAYEDVMASADWTWQQVDDRYRKAWADESGQSTFHMRMLRKAAEGGELLIWAAGDKVVAYAAVKITNLITEDGPTICTSGDLLIVPDLSEADKFQVATDLLDYAKERHVSQCEFQIDSFLEATFAKADYRPQKTLMRKEIS